MDKGKGGHSETSDPDDHSNCNRVTPAVADDAFLAEEDEDCNELYGNIEIGQSSLQPLPINKDSGVKNSEVERKKPPPPQQRPFLSVQNAGGASLPGTSGIGQKQPFDSVGRGSTLFFLGGLHWWTTDADLEDELCKYGKVKEVWFYSNEASGRSRGYCRVEFYDPLAAAACMKGLIGHKFNGRPCVVSSSLTPSVCNNQPDVANQGKKGPDDGEATKPGDDNGGCDGIKEGGDGDNRGNGRGNRGRGGIKEGGDGDNRGNGRGNRGRENNLGMGNRGRGNPERNQGGGIDGRSIMMGGPMGRMGGAAPPMSLNHRMSPMSSTGGYAGFPGGPLPQFPGILPSQHGVGLRGLAPYGNYSFYGRGMPMHGTGMIPPSGMGGSNLEMWPGADTGRWGGDEHGRGKVAESGYGEEAASDHRYNEVDLDRGDSPNVMREKDRGLERDLPVTSERPFEDDRVHEFGRHVLMGGVEHGRGKVAESGYGEEAASDHRYNEVDLDRGDSPNAMREKDRGLERDLPVTFERPFEDDRVHEFDRHVPMGGDEHGKGKVAESGYGEEAASDHRYNEMDLDRGDSPNAVREKDRGLERDLPVTSERPFEDDRVREFDRYVPMGGDEHGRGKVAETGYGEEAAFDHQYNEVDLDRGDSPNTMREKDRGLERELPVTSQRPFEDERVLEFDRYVPSENDSEDDHDESWSLDDREISRGRSRDSDRARSIDHGRDRERSWNRDRHREDRDRYAADHHRFKNHAPQHNYKPERGRSSRTSIKSRLSYPSRKYSHNGKRRQ